MKWDEFTKLFIDNFLPNSQRQKYATQFERLVQTPDMDMATYSAKFCKLARYAPLLVTTEEHRVKRFVHGLVSCLFSSLVPNMSTMTYSEALELDRKIEEKGREKHTTYAVHKKAKIGGSYGDNLSENHKIWNQGKQQGSHTELDLVSQSTYKPHQRQGTQGQ